MFPPKNLARKGLSSRYFRQIFVMFYSIALLAICAGKSSVPGEFPTQRPVTRSLDVYFDLRPNKRLSKQWWCWWFETPSRPLWRHLNAATPCCASSNLANIGTDDGILYEGTRQLSELLLLLMQIWHSYDRKGNFVGKCSKYQKLKCMLVLSKYQQLAVTFLLDE